MGNKAHVPVLPMAAALIVGAVVASAVGSVAMSLDEPSGQMLRLWGVLSLFGAGLALVLGLPLALWRLRDPALPFGRWMRLGLVAGIVTAAVILCWILGSDARFLVGGAWGIAAWTVIVLTIPMVVLAAGIARLLLLAWLRRTRRG